MRPAALSHDNLSEDIIKHFRINEGGAAGASPGNTEFAGLAELGISFDVKAPKVSIRRATPESGENPTPASPLDGATGKRRTYSGRHCVLLTAAFLPVPHPSV
jgi:hypothetical protein